MGANTSPNRAIPMARRPAPTVRVRRLTSAAARRLRPISGARTSPRDRPRMIDAPAMLAVDRPASLIALAAQGDGAQVQKCYRRDRGKKLGQLLTLWRFPVVSGHNDMLFFVALISTKSMPPDAAFYSHKKRRRAFPPAGLPLPPHANTAPELISGAAHWRWI